MSVFSGKIGPRGMAFFCRKMAYSYDAGIPLLNGLKLVSEPTRDRRLRRVLYRMHTDIRDGVSLSEAVASHRRYWPNLFVHMIGAGEVSGRIDRVLFDLADYYERCIAIRRAVMKRLLYPFCLLVAAAVIGVWKAAMIFMLHTTGNRMDFGVFIREFSRLGVMQLGGMAVQVLVVMMLWRFGVWQWIWMQVKTFIWPFSMITRKLAMARFNRALGLLLGSGLGATHAVEHAARAADNPYITKTLLKALPRLETGATLTEAIAPCPHMSEAERQILHTGEVGGTLKKSLTKSADFLEQDALFFTKVIIILTGPIFFLFVVCMLFGGLIF